MSHLIGINYQVGSKRPTMNNKDLPITQEIPKV